MTALATPPAPATRPRPGDEARVVTVFADLLPEEVVAGRRLRALQRNIVFGLFGLVVVLIAVYAVSWWQTENSRTNLNDQQQRTSALQDRLKDYGPLLAAQTQAAGISQTLSTLMANDLSWRDLINRLQKQSHGDVVITGVTGSVADPSAGTATAPSGLALLNDTGKTVVGTLTITGGSHDKRSLAAFVDRLASVRGMTVPLPASVTAAQDTLTYSISALITADALGGRFTQTPPAAAGGK
jgi:type IV pilus assembly protein PilN